MGRIDDLSNSSKEESSEDDDSEESVSEEDSDESRERSKGDIDMVSALLGCSREEAFARVAFNRPRTPRVSLAGHGDELPVWCMDRETYVVQGLVDMEGSQESWSRQ